MKNDVLLPPLAPPPVLGGSRVYCPASSDDAICGWRRRGRSAGILKAYRRHWRRKHYYAGTGP